jgi:hypothetical protein
MRATWKPDNFDNPKTVESRDSAVRCHCGSLMARVVAGGLELKCRRRKRQLVVPLNTKGNLRITL